MSIACIIISNDSSVRNYVPISGGSFVRKKEKKNRKKGKKNMAKVIAFDFLPSRVFDVSPRRTVIDYRGITMIGVLF